MLDSTEKYSPVLIVEALDASVSAVPSWVLESSEKRTCGGDSVWEECGGEWVWVDDSIPVGLVTPEMSDDGCWAPRAVRWVGNCCWCLSNPISVRWTLSSLIEARICNWISSKHTKRNTIITFSTEQKQSKRTRHWAQEQEQGRSL